jgi:hypothetical protein
MLTREETHKLEVISNINRYYPNQQKAKLERYIQQKHGTWHILKQVEWYHKLKQKHHCTQQPFTAKRNKENRNQSG